jgi:predicted alpha/beta hydrolase
VRATDVTFAAADGRRLSGSLREPPTPRAALVLAGATAVPARAYSALAEALAWCGLSVLSFDYRGVGASTSGRLREEAATMADWGRLDLQGALAYLELRTAGLPLLLLGHSVGGQLLGLAPAALALRGALLVGAQSGYWKHWEGRARLGMWLSFHALLPSVASTLGYVPMRAMRMGEDLPAGVARQWARWGRHPEHLLSECSPAERERCARLGFPIRSYHFTDDAFAPRKAVEGLGRFYPGAPREVVTRSPSDVGTSSIGHFGWLKPRFRDTLWREMADWLLARADAVASRPAEGAAPQTGPGAGPKRPSQRALEAEQAR